MVKKRSGLGSNPFNTSGMGIFAPTETHVNGVESNSSTIELSKIVLPKQQPRRYFDPDKMLQLVQSIEEHGILEPLLVRPIGSDIYELVAGERRFRAAQKVGLTDVPALVRQFSDEEALQVALIENLQREDLNPVEETEGILSLLSICLKLAPTEVSQLLHRLAKSSDNVVGKEEQEQLRIIEDVFRKMGSMSWESFATHRLPLLNLPEPILLALREGKLEYTKARAIARLKDTSQQQALLERVLEDGLSLSQIQSEIKAANRQNQTDKPASLKSEFDGVYSRLKKSSVWGNHTKQKRLKKLLAEIELLLEGE